MIQHHLPELSPTEQKGWKQTLNSLYLQGNNHSCLFNCPGNFPPARFKFLCYSDLVCPLMSAFKIQKMIFEIRFYIHYIQMRKMLPGDFIRDGEGKVSYLTLSSWEHGCVWISMCSPFFSLLLQHIW